jgi:hypothetical protein
MPTFTWTTICGNLELNRNLETDYRVNHDTTGLIQPWDKVAHFAQDIRFVGHEDRVICVR